MKSLAIALGLFSAFLIVRQTFNMQAQVTLLGPSPTAAAATDARSRRVAAIEAQDQILALRQQALEAELDRAAESTTRVRDRLERVALPSSDTESPDSEATSTELNAQHSQLVETRRETRIDLERVLAERHRLQEEWTRLTGLRNQR